MMFSLIRIKRWAVMRWCVEGQGERAAPDTRVMTRRVLRKRSRVVSRLQNKSVHPWELFCVWRMLSSIFMFSVCVCVCFHLFLCVCLCVKYNFCYPVKRLLNLQARHAKLNVAAVPACVFADSRHFAHCSLPKPPDWYKSNNNRWLNSYFVQTEVRLAWVIMQQHIANQMV